MAVRHAAVPAALADRWIGSGSDPDADPAALRGLRPEMRRLALRYPPERVLASPSRRARQTAALLGRPVEVDPRLAERHFGAWEGRLIRECLAEVDPLWLQSAERYLELPIVGAEAARAVADRAVSLWRDLATGSESCIWCVGHGGSVRALWAAATGETLARAFTRPLPPGGVILLCARDGGAREFSDRSGADDAAQGPGLSPRSAQLPRGCGLPGHARKALVGKSRRDGRPGGGNESGNHRAILLVEPKTA